MKPPPETKPAVPADVFKPFPEPIGVPAELSELLKSFRAVVQEVSFSPTFRNFVGHLEAQVPALCSHHPFMNPGFERELRIEAKLIAIVLKMLEAAKQRQQAREKDERD